MLCSPRVAPSECPMNRQILTDKLIEALPPAPEGQRVEIFDTKQDRLLVRVTDEGMKTFAVYARFPGGAGPTRRKLGTVGKMKLETARKEARRWLDLIEQGIDPAEDEKRKQREKQERNADTFALVVGEYIRRQVIGPATYAATQAVADHYMADKPAKKLTRLQALAK